MLVVDERAQPVSLSDAHWIGIVKQLFTTADGLGTMESILTCGFSPNTFFHPHSHVEGTEEVWCGMHDTSWRLLGREIFPQPDGEAYLIPPTGKCPHANFNLSDAYVRLFYFARYQDHEVRK